MRDITLLLRVDVPEEARFSHLVMLHGHTVASLESYLASTFISQVTGSDELIRKLVESDPAFSKMKFTMKEIFKKHDSLNLTVAKYLSDLIFHDLKKVKPMFRDVLNIDFGDISWLFSAVNIRHHCAHRAGLDKDGNEVEISADSIQMLVENSSVLVRKIDLDLLRSSFEWRT